jgi:hypothetical protein
VFTLKLLLLSSYEIPELLLLPLVRFPRGINIVRCKILDQRFESTAIVTDLDGLQSVSVNLSRNVTCLEQIPEWDLLPVFSLILFEVDYQSSCLRGEQVLARRTGSLSLGFLEVTIPLPGEVTTD